MERTAVDVRVSGRVQGVGFRWTCELEAERLGVHGWVRNEPDGSVRGHFEGDPESVDALVDWCRHGPSGSRVERLEVDPAASTGDAGFRVTG